MAVFLFLLLGVPFTFAMGWTLFRGPGWFFALKLKARIALVLATVTLAGLAAWRASVEADRAEPVWLDFGTGTHPLAIPIRVQLPPDLDAYAPAFLAAMRMFNEQAGCRLFVQAEGHYDVRMLFIQGEPCDGLASDPSRNAMASTYFCANGGVDISFRRLDDIQLAYVAIAHELGHVLGLAHDPTGLMAPVAGQLMLVYPSEKDTAAVRDRYCTGVHK